MYGERRREDTRRTRLFTTLLLTAAFLAAASILVFNRNGFMAITEMEENIESLTSENHDLERQIDSLQTVIELLQTDSLYMEKRVREVMGWGREGEFIIRLTEPEN